MIRHSPDDIVMFSREYFEAVQNDTLSHFLQQQRERGLYKGPDIDHQAYEAHVRGQNKQKNETRTHPKS